jgi:hypothetical protein
MKSDPTESVPSQYLVDSKAFLRLDFRNENPT